MKPSELYAITPESETNDISLIKGSWTDHLPELNYVDYFDDSVIEKNNKIKIKILKDLNIDGRRGWRLLTVWFEGKPVMITQNAGRELTDHHQRFVTDENLYKQMISYLREITPFEDEDISDVHDLNENIDNLDTFYGISLN